MVLATLKTEIGILARPLTAENFLQFGGVISAEHQLTKSLSQTANYGTATKLSRVSPIETKYEHCSSGKPATINWNLFRCTPPSHLIAETSVSEGVLFKPPVYEYTSKVLERHPFSTQTFLPLGAKKNAFAYMVIVAPSAPNGLPDVEKAQAFLAKGNQAVTYGLATWHAPMIALGETIDFAVLIHENGVPDEDVEEVYLDSLKIQFSLDDDDQQGEGFQSDRVEWPSVHKVKQRKPQSQEAFDTQIDQFHADGPIVQEHDYFDRFDKKLGASEKMDLNSVKYAAERLYYLGRYEEAAQTIEKRLPAARGKMAKDFQIILDAARAKTSS